MLILYYIKIHKNSFSTNFLIKAQFWVCILKLTSVKPMWGFLIRFCKQLLRVLVSSKFVDFLSISSISVELKKTCSITLLYMTTLVSKTYFLPCKENFSCSELPYALNIWLLQIVCVLTHKTPLSLTKLSIN